MRSSSSSSSSSVHVGAFCTYAGGLAGEGALIGAGAATLGKGGRVSIVGPGGDRTALDVDALGPLLAPHTDPEAEASLRLLDAASGVFLAAVDWRSTTEELAATLWVRLE